ncbi:hypothetical protein OG429_24385 [Streptomyces sp. NBC_00190]|uniref:hypothetical protein n=1 Tax=unclassified Streptomyces TaxID=2593676 RepID=UPI002E28809C|nr:hypothetical protein [Streptomyces sp. NBC_00190]WSZ42155.1 hypothetical protein OG239_27160 [Streptomyces sp. NBC_00868]
MAVLVYNRGADWTQELYQAMHDRVLPDPANPPAGLLAHFASPSERGGWQVIDVWESEADFQRFTEEKLIPAAQDLGTPPFETKVSEIYNHLIP